nr:DUF362 domain-containing protein [Dissulfurirhabdus thermomarina]
MVKPNLVEALPPPVTTPPALVGAVVDFVRAAAPGARVVIGEGTGARRLETGEVFRALGYEALAREKDVELLDLNRAPTVRLRRPELGRWPEMHLPRVALEAFLVSVPVLKVHTLAGVTLTLKNMMGLAPPGRYQVPGHWKKSAFHEGMQAAVADLARYRAPDFTLLDASAGLPFSHLAGPACRPPVNRLVAGFDPVALDAYGAGLLGRDWREIGHIHALHGELGRAEPLEVTVPA